MGLYSGYGLGGAMRAPQCRTHRSPAGFLKVATPLLATSPVAHNVIYGVASRLANAGDGADDAFFATAEDDGLAVGVAMRTPPRDAVIGGDWSRSRDTLVTALYAHSPSLPGIQGPPGEAAAFADQWARHTRCQVIHGMRLRLFKLIEVTTPRACPGHPPPNCRR